MTEAELSTLTTTAQEVYQTGKQANKPTEAALGAMIKLGLIYYKAGKEAEAVSWWSRASEHGETTSSINLVNLYAQQYTQLSLTKNPSLDDLHNVASLVWKHIQTPLELFDDFYDNKRLDELSAEEKNVIAGGLHAAASVFDTQFIKTSQCRIESDQGKKNIQAFLRLSPEKQKKQLSRFSKRLCAKVIDTKENAVAYFDEYRFRKEQLADDANWSFDKAIHLYQGAEALFESLNDDRIKLVYWGMGQLCDFALYNHKEGTCSLTPGSYKDIEATMIHAYESGDRYGDLECRYHLGLYLWDNQSYNSSLANHAVNLIQAARANSAEMRALDLPDDLAALIKRLDTLSRPLSIISAQPYCKKLLN